MAHAVAPLFAQTPPRAPRDVLSLVNTNAMMASLALECLERAWERHDEAIVITATASLALGLTSEHFDPRILALNTHQLAVTEAGRAICLARQRLVASHNPRPAGAGTPVQERYSVRCAPQVLGNAAEGLRFAGARILAEALSVADNPIVLEDGMWHGGLFYAAGLATAADLMHDAVARYAEMVDRQVLLLVTPNTSHGLPENLAAPGALHVKGIHQLLSALNQSLRSRAVPARQLSFSCEGNNQDIVPCGMATLLAVDESLALAGQAMRAAAFCAERALCLRAGVDLPAALRLDAWRDYDVCRLT
jgi:histidine ammonia-lyase